MTAPYSSSSKTSAVIQYKHNTKKETDIEKHKQVQCSKVKCVCAQTSKEVRPHAHRAWQLRRGRWLLRMVRVYRLSASHTNTQYLTTLFQYQCKITRANAVQINSHKTQQRLFGSSRLVQQQHSRQGSKPNTQLQRLSGHRSQAMSQRI